VKRGRWKFVAVFAVLLGVGVLMLRPSEGNGWFADDLWHIRSYTGSELASTWTGSWEPNGIGTPGYRPLETLTAHLRSELLGEDSPKKNRYVSVAAAALALTVLAAALWYLGAPLWLGLAAGVVELTSRNFAFTYAWVSSGYHALQMLSFGLALLALAATLGRRRHRGVLLAASAFLWVVTLLLKDQGLFLLPVLLAVAFVGHAPRRYRSSHPDGALGYARLWSVLRAEATAQWGRADIRVYSAAVVALALADVIARFVFVGEVTTDEHSPWSEVVSQTGHVLVLTGNGPSATPIYWAVAGAVLVFALVAPALAPTRSRDDLVVPWLLALLAIFGLVTSLGFAPARSAAYQVSFPLYFYALLLCATAVLVVRMLALHRRAAQAAAIAVAVLAAVSLVASIRGAVDLQHAMGPWSIETIKYEYDLTHGPLAELAEIPGERQEAVNAHLAEVGLAEPRDAEPDDSLPYLYCRAQHDDRIEIPETVAVYGGQDVLSNLEFTCPHVYPPPAG
jgi:hypothetical protein